MLRQNQFICTEQNLTYYSAIKTVVTLQTPVAEYKLCRIIFGSDGSIYIPFPYFSTKQGIVSEVDYNPYSGPPTQLDFSVNGIPVPYDVKFTHHPSGIVHFSKTGEIERLSQKRSFPLETQIGHVFNLFVFQPSGLNLVGSLQARDLHIGFEFQRNHPIGIHLRAEWCRKNDIKTNIQPPGGNVGPILNAIHRETGVNSPSAFLGQPPELPLQNN
ncbi:hypothetical protein ACFL5H_00660, partial [Candidatus Latescibacterota bacterium]